MRPYRPLPSCPGNCTLCPPWSRLAARFGWLSRPRRRRAGGPSELCQGHRGSCSDQLPRRHWSELPKLGRPTCSCWVFAGVCPLLAGLGTPRLPPKAASSHAHIQREAMAYADLGGPPSHPRVTFAPLPVHRPGSLGPQILTGTPHEPTEAGGPGARTTGPAVGCFSQQQLSH